MLIFDEVITGFRVAWGGAQERFGVVPDLTTLGKIIGGGLPVGAFGGRRELMETVAPLGATYQAGTLSGNPLAMAAGAATLRVLAEPSGALACLIDELFFEHHVANAAMMAAHWGPSVTGSIHESLRLFQALRRRGVRMHSWP